MIRKSRALLALMLSITVFTSCGKSDTTTTKEEVSKDVNVETKEETKRYRRINAEDLWDKDFKAGEDIEFSCVSKFDGLTGYDDYNYTLFASSINDDLIIIIVPKELIGKDDIKKDDSLFIQGTTEKISTAKASTIGVRADKVAVID